MEQKIFDQFQTMIETTMKVGDSLSNSISSGAEIMSKAFLSGKTIFCCGDKGGGISAELLTYYLTEGYEIERPRLPAINLSHLCNNSSEVNPFSEVINIHGESSDILFVISAGNNAPNLIAVLRKAIEKQMTIVLISASNDKDLTSMIGYNDVEVETSEFKGQLLTLAQIEIVQCLCSLIDDKIFGGT